MAAKQQKPVKTAQAQVRRDEKGNTAPVARKGGGRSGNPAARPFQHVKPATLGDWVRAARIPTLPMSFAPVLVGTAAARLAGDPGEFHWVRALLCLVVAVTLQIAVNYANDYSDGVRGTDSDRVGPGRLVGSGKAAPRKVLAVAGVFFGIAAVAGVLLTIATQQWWLLAVGAACILAAWFYTGGKRPYGYYALGELFVFIFFGLVATLGTMWVQVGMVSQEAIYGSIGVGLIATSAILVNNLRDRATDKVARKITLAVLLGNLGTRILFIVMMLVPFVIMAFIALFYQALWLGMFALLAALPACLIVATARTSKELILALKLVGLTQLIYGIGYYVAFAL